MNLRPAVTAIAILALTTVPGAAKSGHAPTRADYARIAQTRCAMTKPGTLEPAQEPGEMRPLALYLVAADPHRPKYAFICVDTDVGPRTDVYISYTAFNHRGVMPTYYGDNGPRCRPGSHQEALPTCSTNRFITDGTTLTHVVAPTAVSYEYAGYGEVAVVLTNFILNRTQHPRYYRVPIETIAP